MKSVPADKERRRFLQHAFSIGTLAWLTPAILTVSAKNVYADLSGRNGIIKDHPIPFDKVKPKKPHKPKPPKFR